MVAVEYNNGSTLKFLCSYGGKILPRSTDGTLRYVGGHTRVLSVPRSISFTELTKRLFEFCGYTVDLKCQLPNGDLETLISVKSDEELTEIIEDYDRISGSKIRAVLTSPRSRSQSPSCSSGGERSPKSPFSVTPSPPNSPSLAYGRYMQMQSRYGSPPTGLPRRFSNPDLARCCACRVHKDSRVIMWNQKNEYTK